MDRERKGLGHGYRERKDGDMDRERGKMETWIRKERKGWRHG